MSTPHRNGKAVVLTLDHDVLEMLPLISPGRKAQGRYLSELVRREAARRSTLVEVESRYSSPFLPAYLTDGEYEVSHGVL